MRVNTLSLAPFAGIHRLEVDFEPGLNVLLGPNEAGKSTVVEALYAALFQGMKLRRSVRDDLAFQQRAWHYPDGDHAHLQLRFQAAGNHHTLTKHWQQGKSHISLFDGTRTLVEEAAIDRQLAAFLRYGARTYAHVLFARQHTFRDTLEQLQEDPETAATVDQILKKAVMQLDGVSVEALRSRLEAEIDQLGKRWDVAENRPENNRTIHHPYKTGLGEVLRSYYGVETLRLELEKARRGEMELENLAARLTACRQEQEQVQHQLAGMEAIEPEVMEREPLQLKQDALQKDYRLLTEANKEWPVTEAESLRLAQSIQALQERAGHLSEEWRKAEQSRLLEQDRRFLQQLESLQQKLEQAEAEAKPLDHLTEEAFRELEQQEGLLNQARAAMDGATLLGTLEKAAQPVVITAGFEAPRNLEPGQQVTASGSLRLEMGDNGEILTLQISAGQIDFTTLREAHAQAAANKKELLDTLQADHVEAARSQLQAAREKRAAVSHLKRSLASLVEGRDVCAIREALQQAGEEPLRPLEQVADEKEAVTEELNDQRRRQSLLENQLAVWKKDHESHDSLVEQLVAIKGAMKENENALKRLAELPEGFETTQAFREHLRQLRLQKADLADRAHGLRHQMTDLQHSLPPDSAEEMERALAEAEKAFQAKQRRLHRLLVIRETLEKVLEQLDRHSSRPLEEAFSRYLVQITGSRYRSVLLEESLQVSLRQHAEAAPLTPDLFSTGTYDTVALAFRFALVDQLFPEDAALLVLDDCLVNLDPDRKARTISLIRELAQRHQLIFTTCQPETARQLGGHLIQLRH